MKAPVCDKESADCEPLAPSSVKWKDTLVDQVEIQTDTTHANNQFGSGSDHNCENGKARARSFSEVEASVVFLAGLSKQRNQPLTVCFDVFFISFHLY